MNFATEADRVSAIEQLGDDPKNLEKLEEIRAAAIGEPLTPAEPDVTPPAAETEGAPAPIEAPQTEPAAGQPPADQPAVSQWQLSQKDLPDGYKTPQEALKAFRELRETFERQTNFIKTKLGEQQPVTAQESAALKRAEAAEAELAKLRGTAPAQSTAQTSADIGVVQTEIQKVNALQAELDQKVEADPDYQFTSEYMSKSRELSRYLTQNLNSLTSLYSKAQSEIIEAKTAASNIVASKKQQDETEAINAARNSRLKEMTELDIPELKLSRSASDVEQEYIQWRDDVSLAYYGRPARSIEEKFAALQQLQIKNPELLSKLQVFGVKAQPSADVDRYVQQCEMINYQEGWRKDPATGKWTQLLRSDPESGKQVPLRYPTLKAAIQAKRLEEGFYEKQRDGAFQHGAQTVTQAAQRRDMGAVELDTRSDMGQTVGDSSWALNVLQQTDAEVAMQEYRKGNRTKLDEINKARKALQLEPIAFDE